MEDIPGLSRQHGVAGSRGNVMRVRLVKASEPTAPHLTRLYMEEHD